MPNGRNAGCRCTNRIEPCWATSVTRSAIIIGTGSFATARIWRVSAQLFGDDRQDYAAALKAYYQSGPPADWLNRFISPYSSSHPWEDWAETWAHYLHLIDTLETASECGLVLMPNRANACAVRPRYSSRKPGVAKFDEMMGDWFAVTYLLNNLSRGLGQRDSYPFVLMDPVIDKLRFIHEVCTADAAK